MGLVGFGGHGEMDPASWSPVDDHARVLIGRHPVGSLRSYLGVGADRVGRAHLVSGDPPAPSHQCHGVLLPSSAGQAPLAHRRR
ncbi:hypothetical protein Krad_2837 [Kineococcus radiotolerans SRS30216 = ATCC BAA-149]|uniref:Uncharacterized protein n=1 Tax=Kineococcus radiotolerans (strain ATCC BAA-149 / DSM 14245 / SRS30216) TaxID=266940 RepID=A6WBW6_KINRD|nr:hypothetical protein Krad_2837 [Kineococcus radiotolerans SRS30216 = ATCC BAA-149]